MKAVLLLSGMNAFAGPAEENAQFIAEKVS